MRTRFKKSDYAYGHTLVAPPYTEHRDTRMQLLRQSKQILKGTKSLNFGQ